jgi:hypothetical protein
VFYINGCFYYFLIIEVIFEMLGFEFRAYTLSYSSSPHPPSFAMGFFQDRISQTICPGWLPTTVLLISAY